jgi:low affinity Fe/Cu permease
VKDTSVFTRVSITISRYAGHPAAFTCAALVIVAWGLSGFLFGTGTTWQLVVNTFTTIVTFLMVFLIQSTQNRDTIAMQVKLDELIRATKPAHNALLDLEEMDEKDLERLRESYEELAATARKKLKRRRNGAHKAA